MGFGQGLSGLNAAAQNLDVIGNNVANASTTGFKSAQASFADVYASSRVGLGVKVSDISQRFSTGNIGTSTGAFHVAINGENGFFRLADSNGNLFYSRNGEFKSDKDSRIVNAQGQALMGYPAGGIGLDPTIMTIPQDNIAPKATDSLKVKANLPANADVPTLDFDPKVAESYTASVPSTVYDSLGNPHALTQYFVKQGQTDKGESAYRVYNVLDGNVATAQVQDLKFDSAGAMIDEVMEPITFANPGTPQAPADSLEISISYAGTTQFGGAFKQSTQASGYATGTFSGVKIGADGSVIAAYSNGQTQVVGTVALASFANKQGLEPVGDNAWTETADSGRALLGQPGTNGLAKLVGNALEASNVDMSRELVDMIIAQRTYQANAQTIKTQDQVLQTLLQIR